MGLNLLFVICYVSLSVICQVILNVILVVWIAFVVYYIKLVRDRKIGNQMSFGSDKGRRAVDRARFNNKK
ncbi:MAG: hypothetical protein ACRCVU_03575 [Flavobacterium sp.]